MILDGVSYSAYTVLTCRVISSRMVMFYLESVFLERVLSGLPGTLVSKCLSGLIVFPPMLCY